jgi:outer membrane protein OmpA-like peptidoglycan-associated protein
MFVEAGAQERNIKKLSKHKRHKLAHNLIKRGSYYNASEQLEALVKTYPEENEFTYRLAESYFASRDYKNAELWFKKALEMEGKIVSLALFRYAESLKYNGKYLEAKKAFSDFTSSKYKEAKGEKYKVIAKNEILSCDFAMKELDHKAEAEVVHLGDNINSGYTEFSPRPKGKDTLVFASLQSDSVLVHGHDEVHFHHVKLYTSENKSGEWSHPTELKELNSQFENSANGAFSEDKSKFYFTKCLPDKKHQMICQIYVSEFRNGTYGKPQKLEGKININGFTYTQPVPVKFNNGKQVTEGLLFASNIAGGKGGMDIWFTSASKGEYKKPMNLGPQINTIRDEITPFYDHKTSTLYFSSNFHFGFGGYDIFRTKGNLSKWEKPFNLGLPLNSRVDDTYFLLNDQEENGFLVSNRPGGMHLTSETCCDDIYSFGYKPLSLVAVKIFKKGTKVNLQHAQISMLSTAKKSGAVSDTMAVRDTVSALTSYDTLALYHNKNPMNHLVADIQQFFKGEALKNYHLKVKIPGVDSINYDFNTNSENGFEHTSPSSDTLIKITDLQSDNMKVLLIEVYLKPGETTLADTESKVKKIINISDYSVSTIIKEKKYTDASFKKDIRIILFYDTDDSEFLEGKEESLDSLVTLLNEYPDLHIEVSGHTDNVGSDEYNLDLSRKRAEQLSQYLQSRGVPARRIKSKGHGEATPLMPNFNPDGSENPEAQAFNRRAEIKLVRGVHATHKKSGSGNDSDKKKKK